MDSILTSLGLWLFLDLCGRMACLTHWLTDWLINRLTILWTPCLTYSFINLLTEWLINWLTEWLNHWLTDWLTPWLIWQKIISYILQLSWNNMHNLMIMCSRMSIVEHFLHWRPPVAPFTPLTGWRPCPL